MSHPSMLLADLSPEDRHWLFAQLSENERLQLFELLANAPGGDGDPQSSIAGTPVHRSRSAEDIVASTNSWEIVQAFLEEPDWVIALVLSRRSWPWVSDYFGSMDATRADRLRALSAAVREASRDKAYVAAIAGLAAKLGSVAASGDQGKVTEGGVAGLMGLRPMDD